MSLYMSLKVLTSPVMAELSSRVKVMTFSGSSGSTPFFGDTILLLLTFDMNLAFSSISVWLISQHPN